MSNSSTNIQRYLAELGRRAALLTAARQGGLFLGSLGLLILGLLLLVPSLPITSFLRFACITLVGGVLFSFALLLARSLLRLRRPMVLALLVGHRRPALMSDLLSTVELSQAPEDPRAPYSHALFSALATRTARRLEAHPPAAYTPARGLRPAAVLLSGVCLCWALAANLAPQRLAQGAGLLLWSHGAGAGKQEEAMEPLVGDLSLTYRFPAYMGRAPRRVGSSTGQISAPRGTRVEIKTQAMLPIASASLVFTEEGGAEPRRLALAISSGTALSGSMLISGPGTYRFRVETVGGRVVLDPVQRQVTVEADAYPRLTLYGPDNDLEVTDRTRVELGYIAEDDYGLGEIRLAYQVGGGEVKRLSLWKPQEKSGGKAALRSATGKEEWDLSNADLRPGARIAYWLEATDIDTVSGPKVSQTRPRYLRVYSPELKHKEALRQLSQVLEHGIRVLGDRLLLFEKEPPLAPSLRFDKADLVNKGQLMLRDGLRELSNKLRQDPLATPSLRRSLAKMNRRLLPLVNAEGQAIKGLRPLRRRQQLKEAHLRLLRDGNGRLSVEMERSVLLLADLLNDQRLQGLSRRAKELRQGRARLKELLTRYRKTPSAALKKQILRLIRQLEAQARKLMAEASRLQGAIPDEYLNTEAMAKLDLKEQLQRISDQVRKGELDKLESAMSALDRSLDKLEGMLGQGSQQFRETRMAEQERQYSEVLDRLRGLEREQRQISGKTSKVIRRYRKRAADMMKKTIQPFIRRQLTRLADLTKKVEEINGKMLSAYDQEQLQRIRQRLGELKGLLEQLDLDEALRNSRRARNGLRVLEDDLGEDIEDPYAFGRKDLRKSHRRSRAARKLADEMVADLEAIFPSPSTILGSDDRKEVQKLVRREQNLRRQAKQLENHLAKGGKEGNGQPFISPGLLKKLEDAGQQMGKAGGKMRGMRLQESQGHQEAAADALARAQKEAKGARQPQRTGGEGRRGPRERVKIPGADSFRPPREFREDILEAMKEKAPATYEEFVRRYYEELVR